MENFGDKMFVQHLRP